MATRYQMECARRAREAARKKLVIVCTGDFAEYEKGIAWEPDVIERVFEKRSDGNDLDEIIAEARGFAAAKFPGKRTYESREVCAVWIFVDAA
jgi:hypothetical protein